LHGTRIVDPDPDGLRTAGALLRAGDLVAFATETVYGLGAHALDPAAVARVFAAKGRPADNPLIVHLAATEELERVVADVTPLARELAEAFWPGPLTLVLEARATVPAITTGGLRTVAVRVPGHPVASAVLEAAAVPVAAPSANRSGRPSPTTAAHVAADLGTEVALIVDGGACPIGVESTVVDARGERPLVLREGSVTREDLGLDRAITLGAAGGTTAGVPASPGTRYRHYAPACRVELAAAGTATAAAEVLRDRGLRVGLVATTAAPVGVTEVARYLDAVELARHLYTALRDAESAGVEVLVVESVEPVGVGRAVMDRLGRAADATRPDRG
jgi:L-threonylcarbamoyladenylate synthase